MSQDRISSDASAGDDREANNVAAATVLEKTPSVTIDESGKVVFKPSRAFVLAFSALCILALAVAFDATTLSVALPVMSSELGGTALEAFWSGTSFLLASAVLQPTIAGLSALLGRKYLVYFCCVFFAAGSIVAALANNFTVILIGRVLQGAGGGGLFVLTEVIITDLVPLAYRGQYFSVLSAVWALGTVGGPLIGAGYSENDAWRWIFWINIPIIAVGVVVAAIFLRQARIPGNVGSKLARFDWLGSALFTIGSTSFLFGISTGGTMYEWDSWRCLLPMLLGVVIIVVFGFWEVKFAKDPIVHRGIFNNWDMYSMYIGAILHGAILWSILYILVLYYQGVKFMNPIKSAVAVLPETLTVAPAGLVVGIVVTMTGHYRWSVWVGWTLTTLGSGLLLLLEPDSTTAEWIFLNISIGIGTGMLFPAITLAIQAACKPALNAQAAGFLSFLRTFGQSIGVAISGVIFQNAFRRQLNKLDFPLTSILNDVPEEVIAHFSSSMDFSTTTDPATLQSSIAATLSRDATMVVGVLQAMRPGDARDALVDSYNEALHAVFIALTAFAGFGLVLAVTIRGYSLQQEHVSQQKLMTDEEQQIDRKRKSMRLEEKRKSATLLSGAKTEPQASPAPAAADATAAPTTTTTTPAGTSA